MGSTDMTCHVHDVAEPDVAALMVAFDVTRGQARALAMMARCEVATTAALHAVTATKRGSYPGAVVNTIKHLRQRCPSLAVRNVYGIGYSLAAASAAEVRKHLSQHQAEQDVTMDAAIRDLRRRGFGEQAIAARLRVPYAAIRSVTG